MKKLSAIHVSLFTLISCALPAVDIEPPEVPNPYNTSEQRALRDHLLEEYRVKANTNAPVEDLRIIYKQLWLTQQEILYPSEKTDVRYAAARKAEINNEKRKEYEKEISSYGVMPNRAATLDELKLQVESLQKRDAEEKALAAQRAQERQRQENEAREKAEEALVLAEQKKASEEEERSARRERERKRQENETTEPKVARGSTEQKEPEEQIEKQIEVGQSAIMAKLSAQAESLLERIRSTPSSDTETIKLLRAEIGEIHELMSDESFYSVWRKIHGPEMEKKARSNKYRVRLMSSVIIARIDENTYEVIGNNKEHAILKTTNTKYTSSGRFTLFVELLPKVSIKTNDGFTEEMQVLREWAYQPKR